VIKTIPAALFSVCVFIAACGSSAAPTAPSSSSTTPTTPAVIAGCQVTTSTDGMPVIGGPSSHHLAIAMSTDGVTTTGLTQVLSQGSVPDGVRLPDGSIGVYYVNGATGGVWLARMNGTSLTPVSAITIDGVVRPQGVVDPDATLVNGRVRLAYLNGFGAPGNTSRAMCLAESADGVTFTTLAKAFDVGFNHQQTDPTMVQLPNGSWLMAIRDENIVRLLRSSDGLTFTEYSQQPSFLGVVELGLASDGRVRMYTCIGGITSYVSADSGETWTAEALVVNGPRLAQVLPGRLGICDPSWVPAAGAFIFKVE
jgi:hypothetical protein